MTTLSICPLTHHYTLRRQGKTLVTGRATDRHVRGFLRQWRYTNRRYLASVGRVGLLLAKRERDEVFD